jgi:hypothetical protein
MIAMRSARCVMSFEQVSLAFGDDDNVDPELERVLFARRPLDDER